MTVLKLVQLFRIALFGAVLAVLAGCSNSSEQVADRSNTVVIDNALPAPIFDDFEYPDIPIVPDVKVVASSSNVGAVVYEDSGLVLLPRSLINDSLNEPGAIRELLLAALGEDFPEAANWTFRAINSSDEIWQILYQLGLYVPDDAPFGLIIIGDESRFLDELYEDVFGPTDMTADPATDVIGSIVTSSVSVTSSGATQ